MSSDIRPVGSFKSTESGKAHIPSIIRRELGIDGSGEIPFYLDANCVLLVRSDATFDDIISGLDILKADLKLRTKKE